MAELGMTWGLEVEQFVLTCLPESEFEWEDLREFFAKLELGHTVNEAADAATEVPWSVLRAASEAIPQFRLEIKRRRLKAKSDALKAVNAQIRNGDGDLGLKYLEKADPLNFGRSITVDLSNLSKDELFALAGREDTDGGAAGDRAPGPEPEPTRPAD